MKKSGILSLFIGLIFFPCLHAVAQQKFTVSGTVTTKSKGETIISATIKIGNAVTTSNDYGFYSLTVIKGDYTMDVSAVGMQTASQTITADRDLLVNVSLEDNVKNLGEVIVSTTSRNRSLSSPQMGVEKLSTKDINYIPVLLGEKDILKVVQLLPGVKSAGDGNSGID